MPSPVAVAATTWQLTVTWSPERDLIRRRSTSNAPCGASWLENFNALVCVRVPSRSVRVGLAVGLQSACLAWCPRRRLDSPPRRPQWPFAFLAATGVQALPVSEFRRALLNGCQPALSLGAPDRCSRWPPLPTGPPFGSRPLSMAENRKMP